MKSTLDEAITEILQVQNKRIELAERCIKETRSMVELLSMKLYVLEERLAPWQSTQNVPKNEAGDK